jgi:hypothetical protein
MYLLFVDDNSGEKILQNEQNVKHFLEQVVKNEDNYVIKTFERNVTDFQLRRTKLVVHSYYVITDRNNEYHTLSFYGTKMTFYSEGAWNMDADSDVASYRMYIAGNNEWNVKDITPERGICVLQTAENIIRKIDSPVRYYYRDHVSNRENVDNCNTALYETLAEQNIIVANENKAAGLMPPPPGPKPPAPRRGFGLRR